MKLFEVYNAVSTSQEKPVSTWGALTALKKPPKVAYRLLKYGAKLGAEFEVIEKQRIKLIYEAAGAAEGSEVNIKPGTAEFNKFVQGFNEFLANDSDLEPVGISMDALIDALDAEKGNVLSEQDLAVVEPFFTEKQKPEKPAD